MKLITYSNDNSTSCGILTGDFIIDIPSAWPAPNPPRSVKEILERGRSCLVKLAELLVSAEARRAGADPVKAQVPLDSVKLLAPIPKPGDVIATGTPAGVAIATGQFLQPADKIECTIETLGTLTNHLGHRPKKFYEPLR